MGKIFCLMGKSSTGKDTIFEILKRDESVKLKPIISYTTRPKRKGEQIGQTYHFINKEQLDEYDKDQKVIEQRCYNTVEGPWYYATIDDGQIDLDSNSYIMIVTLEAYGKLISYFKEEDIIPIYICVEDGVRIERALNREKKQTQPNYDEMCRRFLADQNDFSNQMLKKYSIEEYYYNNNLADCLELIKNNICKYLN